jgi:hypothetical protein
MTEAKHGKATSSSAAPPSGDAMGEAFAHNTDLWFTTQAELLANVDALTHAWLNRRREGVDSMRHAFEQITRCQDPAEILRVQHEWFSSALQRAMDDIAALNDGIASMTRKATGNLETAARNAGEPVVVVRDEMLAAAGGKPKVVRSAA